MHYIITDIHNDSWRFMKLLEKMDLKEDDHLYLLGGLFDRCLGSIQTRRACIFRY